MTDHYAVLNVSRDAEDVVIEVAWRALMKRYHPDKMQGDPAASERAKTINAAFDVLKDPESRARYDRTLDAEAKPDWTEPDTSDWRAPQPTHPPPTATSATVASSAASRGNWAPLFFIGLSVLVGGGAIGSLMQPRAPTPKASQSEALPDAFSADETQTRREPSQTRKVEQAGLGASAQEEVAAVEDPCASSVGAVAYLVCADPTVSRARRRVDEAFNVQLAKSSDPTRLQEAQTVWLSRQDALPADKDRLIAAFDQRVREIEADDLTGLY
ncbi:DnaJ domain-containing protein [Brevundimonas nasdae]|uniref:DnaJ domain-containing protein n=1 Tax=Brevundimonas nasdae TaxID=172043 RepID=A0ACD4VLH9_9CAUL|nr:DnaJ domain-containing protein [Brevundimonas nasdae]WOB78686.1 DnaJ domain-containing protein [Brevundimonas nasdae]